MSLFQHEEICNGCKHACFHSCCRKFCHCKEGKENLVSDIDGTCPFKETITEGEVSGG